jgi:hypothetical protein
MEKTMKENNILNLDENIKILFDIYDSHTALDKVFYLVKDLVAQGTKREEILEILEKHRVKFQDEKRTFDEGLIISIMDSLVGWCSPSAMI